MRTLTYVCAMLLAGTPAFAQVRVEVVAPPPPRIEVRAPRVEVRAPAPRVVVPPPPTVRFSAPPPLTVVEPGVQVVEDADDEVFFSSGYYWHCNPDGVWFRTRSYRGGWAVAPSRAVPVAVMRLPRGHYRHFHGHERHEVRHEMRHERHEMRKAEHHHGRR